VRATSPSGDPDFDGVIGWSGDLGFGVRPGEGTQTERDEGTQTERDH
jgi:NADH-quinone oxidoreductase subunit I